MSADGRALFAAIRDDPEDDVSRLAFADWLDEQGDDARALALRMSVERRRLPDWEPRAWLLDARMIRLHSTHRGGWDAALPKLVDGWRSVGKSGLVEHERVDSPRALLDQEEVIFSAGPIESVNVGIGVRHEANDAAPLASCPSMARVRSLALDGMVSPEQLSLPALAASPYFRDLRRLERDQCGDDDNLLEYLADCPPFPALESLILERANFEMAGCQSLSLSPLLGTLRRLTISHAGVSYAGLRHLMRTPTFRRLRELRLSANALTPDPFKGFFSMTGRRWNTSTSRATRSARRQFDISSGARA